jgi:hypothetical protein
VPVPPAFDPSRPRGLLPVLVAALGLLLLAAPARAAPSAPAEPDAERKALASEHLKRGAQLIDAEDLSGALTQFEEAYRLVPSPNILHNFGIVYQGLGRKAAALDAFERFLAEATRAPHAVREHARKAVDALTGQVAALSVQGEVTGASIFVDGRKVGETPREKPVYLDPGPHHLSVERNDLGQLLAERVEVSAGQRLTVQARAPHPTAPAAATEPPVISAPAAPAEAPSRRRWQRPAAWVVAVGAAVAGGLMVQQILKHDQYIREFNSFRSPAGDPCGTDEIAVGPPRCRELLDLAKPHRDRAINYGVPAGLLGIAAAVLFVTMPEKQEGLSLSLRASPADLGLGLQGRF